MIKKTVLTLVKTVLPLLLGIYLIWVFFSGMDPRAKELFYKALAEANYFIISARIHCVFVARLALGLRS